MIHVATLIANIAHGSPIADSLPFLLITDAELELVCQGGSRRVRINDFYTGYKTTSLEPQRTDRPTARQLRALDARMPGSATSELGRLAC